MGAQCVFRVNGQVKAETHVEGSQVSCPLTTMDSLAQMRVPGAHSQSVGVGPRTLHFNRHLGKPAKDCSAG